MAEPRAARKPEETKEVADRQSAINLRKDCNISCKFFFKCPLMKIAQEREERGCLMKVHDPKQVVRFLRLDGGEEGLSTEIEHTLWEMAAQLDLDPTDVNLRKSYTDLLLRFYKLKLDHGLEKETKDLEVTVKTVSDSRSKRVPVGDTVVEVPVEILDDITLDDPESLFNSPNVEEIVRGSDGTIRERQDK